MKIEKQDLQLTKEAYFRLFQEVYLPGRSMKKAFEQIEEHCSQFGYQSYYNSFESFKTAYYCQKSEKFA
ncbi:hypothetical protein [Dyadobacter sp. CY323]|uniref:hypothetical protein n=1 Tax=Dyadobacter sp. CY323 TaxID=2907302 RepID=UPI001F46EA97|nr:hypothetical protein [Dyadobacter sp. CY323]MCE6992092.1 hypothetical protein [Dyadobacter sp. CY323]